MIFSEKGLANASSFCVIKYMKDMLENIHKV